MSSIGLTSEDAQKLLKANGLNEIPATQNSPFKKFLRWFVSPIALMLLTASFLSFFIHRTFDGYLILALMFLNSGVGFWQEKKADDAIEKLNQHLAVRVKVLRDGKWELIDSRFLVVGDVIELGLGSVVPADGKIIELNNLSVNESALTGESLPKEKKVGDVAYSGSFIFKGMAKMEVTSTGKNTYFGKTLLLVDRTRKKSALEEDILRISKFLSVLSIFAVVILTVVFVLEKAPWAELVTLDLSLVIAGIPISLLTVMTLIIELGVLSLAGKNVIVRRLSALEDLANVNLLLTDKTGTLTKNEITVQKIISYGNFGEEEVIQKAFWATNKDEEDAIDKAIDEKARLFHDVDQAFRVVKFTPADSERKRSSVQVNVGGKNLLISVGAPQVIEGFSNLDQRTKERFEKDVAEMAKKGYRSLAVAFREGAVEEKNMTLAGLLALSDTLREDSKEALDFIKENRIAVIMLTGDNRKIAEEVAKKLGLKGQIIAREAISNKIQDKATADIFADVASFAEIFPDDKYQLVKRAKEEFAVAVNGDGVNDIPAVKEANVGIAVKNAVDALKATADIILLSDGIAVIKDALIESRKVFARLYSYSVYRISESLRLIVTIAVLGLIYRLYPLTPVQLVLLALLNDIPIISLAFDRVKIATSPAKIKLKERFILSSLFGMVGVANSLILFLIMTKFTPLGWGVIQTIYFLKLTVSGHMLIYVARTKERWFNFLPSREVILATTITQLIATTLAFSGFFMPAKVPIFWILVVWLWSFFWMQVAEAMKDLQNRIAASWKQNFL